jgi:hypothetical protein
LRKNWQVYKSQIGGAVPAGLLNVSGKYSYSHVIVGELRIATADKIGSVYPFIFDGDRSFMTAIINPLSSYFLTENYKFWQRCGESNPGLMAENHLSFYKDFCILLKGIK